MPVIGLGRGCGLAAVALFVCSSFPAASRQAPAAMSDGAGCTPKVVAAKLNYTLKDQDDNKVKLADFKGKVIVLNFWATWCGPCKVEIPAFVELQRQYESQGVQFVGISVDDTAAKLRPYVAEHSMNYPVLQGKSNEGLLDAYGPLAAVPTTYLIKRDGNVCKRHSGEVSKDVLERELKSLVD
jgi:peroxiredoxin